MEELDKTLRQSIIKVLNRVSENGATEQDTEFLKVANEILGKTKITTNSMLEQMLPQLLTRFMGGGATMPTPTDLGGMGNV
ncbi:hypothetical protein EOL99_03460 [Candidatus Falkowbacteria bacterium]|nr:hypothetical protein [Candidatus Falkowbacteria bacterium]